jgi:methylmalonyl-CoA mutase
VADPAGGSWFVERLTNDLARAAWDELRSIEAGSGIVAALGSGRLVDAVGEVADSREKQLAKRKTPVVGVSEFPNLHEAVVNREAVSAEEIQRLLKASVDSLDLGSHGERLRAIVSTANDGKREPGALTDACVAATTGGADMYSVATVLQHGQPDFHVEPILQWRAAEVWEQVRARSDQQPSRPVAFFANLGSVPSHTPRFIWTQNLTAAVGVDAATNDGFSDMEALATGWKESSASFAVICGSDKDYEAMLEPAVSALKMAGCPVVLVAGRLGEREAALREAGVSDFLFVGADVLGVMTEVLDSIGVPR